MKVVLFQPLIPQNTGNIARTCLLLNAELLLVRPMGFNLSDKMLKRAGMDYWKEVKWDEIDHLEQYLKEQKKPFYFFSSKAAKLSTEVSYTPDDLLIFGNESSGLPEYFHKKWPEYFVKIPMKSSERCYNLANSAAMALFEAERQLNFVNVFSKKK